MQDVLRSANEQLYCHRDQVGRVVGPTFQLGGASIIPYKLHANVFTQYYDILLPVAAIGPGSSVDWSAVGTYVPVAFVDVASWLPMIKWGNTAVEGTPDSRLPTAIKRYLRFDHAYLLADANLTGIPTPTFNGVGTQQIQIHRNNGNALNAGGGKIFDTGALAGVSLPDVSDTGAYVVPADLRYLRPTGAANRSNMFSLAVFLAGGATVTVPGYIRVEMQFTVFG